MAQRVLVDDDDPTIRRTLRITLRARGPQVEEVGARPDICTIEVPRRTVEVSRPHQASGVKASEPQASAVKIASKPASSAAITSSCALVGGCAPQ